MPLEQRTVLHLIETSDPDGAEHMMVHLATGLDPEYRSEAAIIRAGWLGVALQRRGVPVTLLRYKSGSFAALHDFITLWDLVRLIRKKRVAILHAHEFFMNTLGVIASRVTGVPIVATVHGKNYYTDRLRRRLAYRLVGKCSHQVVAVSGDLKDFLTQWLGMRAANVTVIANGVALREAAQPGRVLALRKKLGLNGSGNVIGTVGRLSQVKGHNYLIDGAMHIVRRCPNTVFLVVGDGELRAELELMVQRVGVAAYFRFLGHRDDVPEILGVLDVFVLSSVSEGMPLSLLEAMAAGLPSVATRVGGVSELVDHGKTGLLVPPADSQALAESITTLLENQKLAKEMGEAARLVATRRFSVSRMIDDYKEIYGGLIGKPEAVAVQS